MAPSCLIKGGPNVFELLSILQLPMSCVPALVVWSPVVALARSCPCLMDSRLWPCSALFLLSILVCCLTMLTPAPCKRLWLGYCILACRLTTFLIALGTCIYLWLCVCVVSVPNFQVQLLSEFLRTAILGPLLCPNCCCHLIPSPVLLCALCPCFHTQGYSDQSRKGKPSPVLSSNQGTL